MADLVLNTEEKTTIGSRSSRRLRRDGKYLAFLWIRSGLNTSVDYGDLRGALTTDAGLNALIQLSVMGQINFQF